MNDPEYYTYKVELAEWNPKQSKHSEFQIFTGVLPQNDVKTRGPVKLWFDLAAILGRRIKQDEGWEGYRMGELEIKGKNGEFFRVYKKEFHSCYIINASGW